MTACMMPDRADFDTDEPPEQYGAWRTETGLCDHPYCIEAAYWFRLFRNAPREPSTEELDEMNADLELVMDETGGRGFGR